MADDNEHPEQDPAEGSRETIERDLKRMEKKAGLKGDAADNGKSKNSEAGAEAAEPSPGT